MIWLWLGCSEVDPDFALNRANAICARHAACDTLSDAGFSSEEGCRAALRQAAEDLVRDGGLACDAWDAEAADACLAAYGVACTYPLDLSPCTQVCGPL